MGSRNNRDPLTSNIDAQREALLISFWEVANNEVIWAVTDIEVHTVRPQPLHFVVDSSRNDVSGSQLSSIIESWHEPRAVLEVEGGAFAPECLGH